MKTFLRTTLFRFVALIAFFVVSGFGNLVDPVFDQSYLVRRIPASVTEKIKGQIANEVNYDYQNAEVQTSSAIVPATQPQNFQQSDISELLIGQANLHQQMNEHFDQLSQQFQTLTTICQRNQGNEETETPIIDETAQRRAELQAQIEALQTEYENLVTN